MYKETLRSIDGVSLFPVIAIIIFIVFFLLVLFFTFRMDKKHVFQFASLPLDQEKDTSLPPIQHT